MPEHLLTQEPDMENVRVCPQCGDTLPTGAHKNRVYCSQPCLWASKRPPHPGPRVCARAGCAATVEGDSRKRFCRRECTKLDEYARLVGLPANRERERPCPACGRPFLSLFGRLACSAQCIREDKTRRSLAAAKEKRLAERIARGTADCDACGHSLPPGHLDHQRYCSQPCRREALYGRWKEARKASHLTLTCINPDCATEFEQCRTDQVYCSRKCKVDVAKAKYAKKQLKPRPARLCAYEGCRKPIPEGSNPTQRWCSPDGICCAKARRFGPGRADVLAREAAWRAANRDITRESSARAAYKRRGQGSAAPVNFRRIDVFREDGWVCQLCGGAVRRDVHYNHPLAPSLDHIRPLARGGLHVRENVQLAHMRCNQQKNAYVET